MASRGKRGDEEAARAKAGAKPLAKVRHHDAHVLICTGGDCKKRGARRFKKAVKDAVREEGLLGDVRIDTTDCLGLCKHGPNAVVYDGTEPRGSWYLGLLEDDVPELVEQHLKGGKPVERLVAYRRPRKAKGDSRKR